MFNKTKFYLLILSDYQFLATYVLDILNRYEEPELQLGKVKAKLKAANDKLLGSAQMVKSKAVTEVLAKLDLDRDDAWMSFYHYLISCSRRLNSESREFADRLLVIASVPEMHIHNLGYQKQTVNTTNFFNIIDADVVYTEALEKISANVLYNELKSAQAVFEEKEADKFNDGTGKEKSESVEATKDIRTALVSLEKLLSTMNDLTDKPEYLVIATAINEVVDQVNAKALGRTTRRKNSKAEEVAN
ncbi:DUF6261 family protein [Labilibaculum antarcticum]|uniref:Uncharacterized protein n=1 Tax=Labilibaculum antarcticum TaxID=1717717 RepID=A0A1Y1CN72_9BACT|nr:DUF6261 family protein [Labilibaculum antarcticum]BAX81866.1 hypothetical protein ALGA_3568 [Labilibaculum antarcticum]